MAEEDFEAMKILREKSYRFRTLEESHHRLEASLASLSRRKILSPEEEFQKKTYQKEKLAAKDTMMKMMQHYRTTGEADSNTG
ncbi:MAG: DUF465 domain-containing protein [Nitrospiria bacterium]